MKFTFEANMYKGECYRCPMCKEREIGSICAIDDCLVSTIEDSSECPLKEANEVIWHPYPSEKPPRKGVYFICITEKGKSHVDYFYYKGKEFIIFDDLIEAWAEIYVPYKEKKHDE